MKEWGITGGAFEIADLCLGPSATSNESEDSSEWNAQYNAMESTQEAFQEKNSNRILVKL